MFGPTEEKQSSKRRFRYSDYRSKIPRRVSTLTDILRSRVIRLAHQKPELRPLLLPLLGVRTADDKTFDEAVKGKKFRNPETGNDVTFGALPAEEQKKVRAQWDKKNSGGSSKEPSKAVSETADKLVKHLNHAEKGVGPFRANPAQTKKIHGALQKLEEAGVKFSDKEIADFVSGDDDLTGPIEKKYKGKPGFKELDDVLNDIYLGS